MVHIQNAQNWLYNKLQTDLIEFIVRPHLTQKYPTTE